MLTPIKGLKWLAVALTFAISQLVCTTKSNPQAYMAMCTSVKDDIAAVREWVQYHHCLGVEHFYIYDDSSNPPMLQHLRDLIDAGIVDYRYVQQGKPAQLWAYNDCLRNHRNQHQWIMSCDVDEFVVLNPAANTTQLPEFLQDYEDYGAVAVQWKVYGSSGLKSTPRGGMLRNYHECMADNTNHNDGYGIKTIANTAHAKQWVTAHSVTFFDPKNYWTVEADHKQRTAGSVKMTLLGEDGTRSDEVRQNFIQLNHYAVRSVEDFERKLKRGTGDGAVRSRVRYWERIENISIDQCGEGQEAGLRCFGSIDEFPEL